MFMGEKCGFSFFKEGVYPESIEDKKRWDATKKYCMTHVCPNNACIGRESEGMDRQYFMDTLVPPECYYDMSGEIVEKYPIGVPKKPLRA